MPTKCHHQFTIIDNTTQPTYPCMNIEIQIQKDLKKVKTVLADLSCGWINSQDTKNNENHAFTMKLSMNFEFVLIYE